MNVTQLSGNPGYLVRQPVRAGRLTTNAAGLSYPLLTSFDLICTCTVDLLLLTVVTVALVTFITVHGWQVFATG